MSSLSLTQSLLASSTPAQAAFYLVSAVSLIFVAWVARNRILTPYRQLPSPPGLSLRNNHSSLTFGTRWGRLYTEWFKSHGSTLLIRVAPYYRPEILSCDPSFVRHVHAHVNDFEGTPRLGAAMRGMGMFGALPTVSGEKRQRIRAVFERSCSLSAMRGHFPKLLQLAYKTRDKIMDEITTGEKGSNPTAINASTHVVGYQTSIIASILFGFNDEEIVQGKANEFQSSIMAFIKARAMLKWWDSKNIFTTSKYRNYVKARRQLAIVGKKMLREKQEKITRNFGDDLKSDDIDQAGDDIVTAWCRLNMSKDIPASQKISDQDLADNVPISMIATLDVSRLAINEIVHRLAVHQDVQLKLRRELATLSEEPSLDDLSKLAYLNAFIEEILRIDNPYANVERTCTRTSVVPLRDPIKLKNGQLADSVTIHRGTDVSMPLWNIGTDSRLFGQDPEEFRPERHLDGSCKGAEGGLALHAAWGTTPGFSGGQRGCPVYQFPLAFMRAFIFVMVRSFEISEPKDEVVEVWVSSSAERREQRINGKAVLWIPTIFKPISQDL